MRRFTSFIGVTVLALLMSGGGNVLAASLCPYAMGSQPQVNAGKALAHEHATQHQAMDGMEMPPASQAQHCSSNVAAFSQPTGTCAHCFGQRESQGTLASLRELTLQRRDAGASIEPVATPAASLAIVFTPQFIPTQNAPPGASNRKHLLLGVFLI